MSGNENSIPPASDSNSGLTGPCPVAMPSLLPREIERRRRQKQPLEMRCLSAVAEWRRQAGGRCWISPSRLFFLSHKVCDTHALGDKTGPSIFLPCWCFEQLTTDSYFYRASIKGGPKVARNFCLAVPGCCLAKHVPLLVQLCRFYNNEKFQLMMYISMVLMSRTLTDQLSEGK